VLTRGLAIPLPLGIPDGNGRLEARDIKLLKGTITQTSWPCYAVRHIFPLGEPLWERDYGNTGWKPVIQYGQEKE